MTTKVAVKEVPQNKFKRKDILETFNESFPLFQKIYEVYEQSPVISQDPENTLRRSVEETTLEVVELVVVASRQGRNNARETLKRAAHKLDTLKVFVDLAGQTGLMDEKEMVTVQETVESVGKMVGGWRKKLNESKDKDEQPKK